METTSLAAEMLPQFTVNLPRWSSVLWRGFLMDMSQKMRNLRSEKRYLS